MVEIKITCKGSSNVSIEALKEFQGDLKSITPEEIEKIKKSILQFGFSFPVFVWKNNILDGHQRLMALRDLIADGNTIKHIPIVEIEAKNKSEAAKKLLLINSRYATITQDGFDNFIQEFQIELNNIDEFLHMPEISFEMPDFDGSGGLTDDDDVPEPPAEPVTKPGDLYKLGNHRLLCGDSTNKEDVERLMGSEKADVVFCDPPYGVSYADKNAMLNAISPGNRIETVIENDHKNISEMKDFWVSLFKSLYESSSGKASYYITGPQGGELMMMMMMSIIDAGWQLKHMLIWSKNNHVLGRCDYHYKHEPILYGWKNKGTHKFYGNSSQFSVWEIDKPQKSDLHPTMKPVELVMKCIENSSKINDIVIDFCLGSGTSIIAAEKTNRKCYGIELDPHYCDVIIKRWEDYTGKKAEKL